jgi:hypothetical protein
MSSLVAIAKNKPEENKTRATTNPPRKNRESW